MAPSRCWRGLAGWYCLQIALRALQLGGDGVVVVVVVVLPPRHERGRSLHSEPTLRENPGDGAACKHLLWVINE